MEKYVFKPYSTIFPKLYQKEKERIMGYIPQLTNVEHVGSTAVPGLGGKGIIDIAIAVEKTNLELASRQLQALGYEFRPSFSTSERLYFIAFLSDVEDENRRYHVHLTYPENSEWINFLKFRDYLISHPEEAQGYAQLKEQAALDANGEGEHYRKLKAPFFKKIYGMKDHAN